MFPSKETVSCFYCEWTGRVDKLASHSTAHHPGSKVHVRIAPNALSTFWKQNSVPLATDQVEKRTNVNDANEDSPTFDQTQVTTTSSFTSPVTTPITPSPSHHRMSINFNNSCFTRANSFWTWALSLIVYSVQTVRFQLLKRLTKEKS